MDFNGNRDRKSSPFERNENLIIVTVRMIVIMRQLGTFVT
jgi:hypothetical protein